MHKQAYIFTENDAIVPIENSTYVIYHDPTKRSFKCDHKMKQMQQISIYECELSMRLSKIQKDPLLSPTTMLTCIKPKQLIGDEYHDYSEYD